MSTENFQEIFNTTPSYIRKLVDNQIKCQLLNKKFRIPRKLKKKYFK